MSLTQVFQAYTQQRSQDDEEYERQIKKKASLFNLEEDPEELATNEMNPDEDFGVSNSFSGESLYSFSAKTGQTKIKPTLNGVEARAILDLVSSQEGAIVNNGANLLITSNGKKLFETDADGVVTFSIAQHDQNFSRRQSPLSNSMELLKGAMKAREEVESHTKDNVEVRTNTNSTQKIKRVKKSQTSLSTAKQSTQGAETEQQTAPAQGAETEQQTAAVQGAETEQQTAPAQGAEIEQQTAPAQGAGTEKQAAATQGAETEKQAAPAQSPPVPPAPAQSPPITSTPVPPAPAQSPPITSTPAPPAPAQSPPMTPLLGTDERKVTTTREDLNILGKYYRSPEYKQSNPGVVVSKKTNTLDDYKSAHKERVRAHLGIPNLEIPKLNSMKPSPEAKITMTNEDIENLRKAQEWQKVEEQKANTLRQEGNREMKI